MQSITRRFQWLFTLGTSLLLCVSAAVLYLMLYHYTMKDDYEFVHNEVRIIRQILTEHGQDIRELRQEIILEPRALKNRFYTRIYADKKRLLLETPEMSKLAEPKTFLPAMKGLNKGELSSKLITSNGKTYRLVAVWLKTDKTPTAKRYLIQVAFDVTHQQQLLAQLRIYLLIITLIGMALAAMSSVFLVRRGLRPIKQLSYAIQQRDPDNLNRLEIQNIPEELMPLADAFNDLMMRIEFSMQQLKRFSADLAHELRTPVNNLMGETEVALTQERSVEGYQTVLQSNLEEYQRLATIIDQMLFLARTENAELSLQKETINVRDLLEHMNQYYHALFEENQIQVVCAGDVSVFADRGLLQRALSNLLTNALKYAPKASTIQWQIKRIDESWGEISILDQGPGIAPEHHDKIFDRFYRIDSARTQKTGGYGLGLSIVRSIVELHQGELSVSSDGQQGTCFSLRLLLQTRPAIPAPVSA